MHSYNAKFRYADPGPHMPDHRPYTALCSEGCMNAYRGSPDPNLTPTYYGTPAPKWYKTLSLAQSICR
jgi:hypothetical protein